MVEQSAHIRSVVVRIYYSPPIKGNYMFNVDLEDELIKDMMDYAIEHKESKEFLVTYSFEEFGKAKFNDLVIDLMNKHLSTNG